MEKIPVAGELWQHYKTKGEYEILGMGHLQVKLGELDMKECVIYKALSDQKLWVRPLADFIEEVQLEAGDKAARFAKIR